MLRQGDRIWKGLVLALYLGICGYRAWTDPAIADEVDFILPLRVWVESGPVRHGMWHTPFYPWILTGLGHAFGMSVAAFRSVGILCVLATAVFVQQAWRELRPSGSRRPSDELCLWILSLFLPALFGAALILDYDNTLLLAATAWFFRELIRASQGSSSRSGMPWGLGISFAACLMAKETTPWLYPVGIWLTLRSTTRTVQATLLGVGIFLATVVVWCRLHGIAPLAVFEMAWLGLKLRGQPGGEGLSLARSLWVKASPLFWLGGPTVAAALCAAFIPSSGTPLLAQARKRAIGAVTVLCAGVLLAYTFGLRQMSYHFPKYMVPVIAWIPFLSLLRAPVLEAGSSQRSDWLRAGAFIAAALAFFLVPDPLSAVYGRDGAHLLKSSVGQLGVPLALGLAFYFFAQGKELGAVRTALWLMAALSLAHGVRAARFPERSVTYWYGERALWDASQEAKRLRAQAPLTRLMATAKDLGIAIEPFGGRHFLVSDLERESDAICKGSEPVWIVSRAREDTSLDRSPALQRLRQCLRVESLGPDLRVAMRP